MIWHRCARTLYGTGLTCNLRPIESNRDQGEPSPTPKHLIEDHIVWADPVDKSEHTQELSDVSWEPVPDEGASEDVKDITIAGYGPAMRLGRVGLGVIVQSIHEDRIDQGGWPDH